MNASIVADSSLPDPRSDARRLAPPWVRWAFAGLAAAYAATGLHLIRPGEVGLVCRFGRLVGDPTATARGPGLAWTWPAPIEQLVRVPARREIAVGIEQFASESGDAVQVGERFAITGDHALVNLRLTAKLLVTNAVAFHRSGPSAIEQCRRLVAASTLRIVARSTADDVLQLRGLSEHIRREAQGELDRFDIGIQLTNIEVGGVGPPPSVRDAFEALQTARIDQETTRHRAQAFADETLIDSQSLARQTVAEARGAAVSMEADAIGRVALFQAAMSVYEKPRPDAALEQLRQDALRKILATCRQVYLAPPGAPAGQVRIVVAHERDRP
ncbi:MAG TPA: SPFH domain-containing protein [Pirellulaceae bacterium]|nr:SPFH domain-containing protein [Pirellulaceae bacterium]